MEAAFTRVLSFMNSARMMRLPVIRIETYGVLNLPCIFLRKPGMSPSRLRARG